MENHHIYSLITKYLNGQCTEQEIKMIFDWCNQSPENKKEFISLKKTSILTDSNLDKQISASQSKVWNKIVKQIPVISNHRVYSKRSVIYYSIASMAATVLLLIGIHYLFIQSNVQATPEYTNLYIPKGEKGQLFLPDGTKVWLNANSRVTFDNGFNVNNRTVRLEGEAYFEVIRHTDSKFIVRTDGIDVVVHGTAFNVAAHTDSPDVSVSLKKGLVSICANESEEALTRLSPNQQVTINKYAHDYKIRPIGEDNEIAWTFDQLIFEHTPIEKVFPKMENWYGVNITVNNAKPDLKYRFKIKSESLTEILELINKMTPINYKIDGKEVTINYK